MMDVKFEINYDKIVNFMYEEDDIVSKMLVANYRDYIFDKRVRNKKRLDFLIGLYTDKDDFYKFVREYFTDNDDLFDSCDNFLKNMEKVYKKYDKEKYEKIDNTRWL